jgi:Flp pilus assembly protein TadD
MPIWRKHAAHARISGGSHYYLVKEKLQRKETAEAVELLQRAAELDPNESVVSTSWGAR